MPLSWLQPSKERILHKKINFIHFTTNNHYYVELRQCGLFTAFK